MSKAKLKRLLHQYLNNSISREDCIELLNYLNNADPGKIEELIDVNLFNLDEGPEFGAEQSTNLFNRIKSDTRFGGFKSLEIIPDVSPTKFYHYKWIRIAAAALVFFTAGLLFLRHERIIAEIKSAQVNANNKPYIVPGGKKATLTINKGEVIVLNNAANGVLAQTGAGKVIKTQTGQIVYNNPGGAPVKAEQNYNTLSTPKGGEYQVVLADGTRVWLNAASSITYPTAFTGNERRVTLTGEAYFEVAKNKDKPFYINAKNTQIRVLGTHFNVAAYADDNEMTTTLLEGSVQLTKNNAHLLLKPGQKAIITNNANNIAVSDANIQEVMAWKNGYFIFDDDDITGIMKKVSRWYDVSVSYHSNLSDQKFGGTFYRSKSITELLQYLGKIGKVKFTVEGRRIIVMK